MPTDWSAPGTSALARIPDTRVRQFWDPHHLVSQELTRKLKENPSQPQPKCCIRGQFFWDDVLVYAPGTRWADTKAPVFWNGAVIRVLPELSQKFDSPTRF